MPEEAGDEADAINGGEVVQIDRACPDQATVLPSVGRQREQSGEAWDDKERQQGEGGKAEGEPAESTPIPLA